VRDYGREFTEVYRQSPAGKLSDVADQAKDGGDRPEGARVLEELGTTTGRDELAGWLAGFGREARVDNASRKLAERTGDQIDLGTEDHRLALISWLRAWGCRHLRRADTAMTSDALRGWWEEWGSRLPGDQDSLTGLDEDGLLVAGRAYEALRGRPAARRSVKDTDVDVSFGDTAAAKALYALRPRVFPPWDERIRLSFGPPGGSAAYLRLLRLSAAALDGLARRLGVPAGDLPEVLGRPASTPPRLIDELLLVKVGPGR
jgi:hypothetical protein